LSTGGVIASKMPVRKGFFYGKFYPVLTVIVALLVWQGAVVGLNVPSHLLPSPTSVLSQLVTDFPVLVKDIFATGNEILIGFAVCVLVSVPLSILVVWVPVLDRAIMPLLIVTQTIPVIAIVPVLIIWFGVGLLPKIIIVFLLGFFQLMLLTVSGLKSVEPEMLDLMRSMSASTFDIFRKVRFPAALPFIFNGMKLAALLSVVGAVVAEIVAADFGLGHVIVYAISEMNSEMLFGALVLLSAIGGIIFYLLVSLERIVLHWHVAMRKEEYIRDVG
jgi:NitT/TauT family transport system permease protein